IEGIAMGSHSEGPLLVVWDVEPQANRAKVQNASPQFNPRVWAALIDPNTLKPIRIKFGSTGLPLLAPKDDLWFVPHPTLTRSSGVNPPIQVHASARGDLFTISAGNGSALIATWDSKTRRRVLCICRPGGQETLIPAPDGRSVLTGSNRTIRLDERGASGLEVDPAKLMATSGVSSIVLPTADPGYYLRFDTDPQAGTSVSILLPSGEVLLKEPVQDPRAQDRYRILDIDQKRSRLKGKKLFLFVEAQRLVLIPSGDNRLVTVRIALRD